MILEKMKVSFEELCDRHLPVSTAGEENDLSSKNDAYVLRIQRSAPLSLDSSLVTPIVR